MPLGRTVLGGFYSELLPAMGSPFGLVEKARELVDYCSLC